MEIESPQSLFDSAKDASELISLTEFFLAILNIFCRDQNLSEANFGAILDRNKQLTQHLAEVVIKALKEHQSVEEALLKATCEKKDFSEYQIGLMTAAWPSLNEILSSFTIKSRDRPNLINLCY